MKKEKNRHYYGEPHHLQYETYKRLKHFDENRDEYDFSPEHLIALYEALKMRAEEDEIQKKWEKKYKDEYLKALKEAEAAMEKVQDLAPPMIQNSELYPFNKIDSVLSNLYNHSDEDVWYSSLLC